MKKIVALGLTLLTFVYTVCYFAVFFVLVCVVWLFTLPFDATRKATHYMLTGWSVGYLALSPAWRVRITGRKDLCSNTTYIFIANHQSALDIIILYTIRWRFKWVAKHELFRTPFFGPLLRMGDYVSIRRASRRDAQHMIAQCSTLLKQHISIVLFPEGTRSKNGRVQRFKSGAFLIAKENNVPIVPIVVSGPYDAMQRKPPLIRPRTFSVHILPPIPQETIQQLSVEELSALAHDTILTQHQTLNPDLYPVTEGVPPTTPPKKV